MYLCLWVVCLGMWMSLWMCLWMSLRVSLLQPKPKHALRLATPIHVHLWPPRLTGET